MTDVPPPPPPASYGGGGGTPQPMANPLIGYWKKVVLENYANFSGREDYNLQVFQLLGLELWANHFRINMQ